MTGPALRILRRLGIAINEERFAEAHGTGNCYLCKVPRDAMLWDCPCPHWLLMPVSEKRPVGDVLDSCGVATVLAFLLLHIHTGIAEGKLTYVRLPTGATAVVKVGRRTLTLTMTGTSAHDGPMVLMHRTTRGREDLLASVRCRPAEAKAMVTLTRIAARMPVPDLQVPLPLTAKNDARTARRT